MAHERIFEITWHLNEKGLLTGKEVFSGSFFIGFLSFACSDGKTVNLMFQ